MCLREGTIRYVTALGATDTSAGWRENKRSGGILMDLNSGQITADRLSMPHSPRWHEGKLWVLESGNGGIGTIDEQSGRYQEMCRLPGFTRGLDFAGPYVFVGLSQVRETAVFSGIAIAENSPGGSQLRRLGDRYPDWPRRGLCEIYRRRTGDLCRASDGGSTLARNL